MQKITFKDEGQDFLEWDVKDGVVVDCRPFQSWLWNGAKVLNKQIEPGDRLEIMCSDKVRRTIIHPVESVK